MKLYVAEIHNYDALDGYMTSTDVKLFFDINAFHKWLSEENERQQKHGFNLNEHSEDSTENSYCEFIKKTLHGNKRHAINGYYCEVIN
ncbi:MAG: hypothetical protein K6F18_03425 [Lactobacillus sp.]|nr:hypothetical protein [Lactobacillus sp.]